MPSPCPADPIAALTNHARDPRQNALHQHLQECASCRDLFQRINRDERLLTDLRGGHTLDAPARDRIRRICRDALP